MDDQNQIPSWEEDSNIPDAPLRRPNPQNPTNNLNLSLEDSLETLNLTGSFSPSNVRQNIPIQSNLSAEAEEWYPASYRRPSAQYRLLKYKQNQHEHQNDVESNGICVDDSSELSGVAEELQGFINVLIDDPGQFDGLLDRIMATLAPYYSDINILDEVAKLIFSEAVAEPNFRYSAARLCRILEEQSPLFRTALHLFAKKLVETVPSNCECDLALTLAELFAQSNCDNLYGNFVAQSIEKIVSVGTLDSVKSVCQVLKLTGARLDADHRPKMNSIFDQLELVKPMLPSLVNLIDYVMALRASHWGQADMNSSSVVPGDRHSPSHLDGPIFYGPDGKELSEEEKQFLSENCVEFFSDDFLDSDPDELFDPDNEMDEEVHAAFREFSKSNRE